MALRLRYVGGRPYTEITVNGVKLGFARGMERDDIDDAWIKKIILPAIEAGAEAWEVDDLTGTEQAVEMAAVLEESTPEPEPEPEAPAAVVVTDEQLLEVGFSSGLTRAQMMAWASQRGISVVNTDTKVSLTEKARAYAGASE